MAIVAYHFEKTMRLLRRSTKRSIFRFLSKGGNANEPGCVPSIETNASRKKQRLEDTANWSKTSHSSVSKYVLTGLARCDQALPCSRITFSRLFWFNTIPSNGFTRFQKFRTDHTELVPPNAEHNLGTVNI